MLPSPAVLALVGCSAVVCAVVGAAAIGGLPGALAWDPDDPGPRQLARERRALLAEAAVKVALACQLASLVLFVLTLERLHPLFPGAMCAAGTLAAGRFGGAALAAKVAVFLLAGLWLVVHRAAAAASALAVVRARHLLLLAVAAALAAETLYQTRYFASLEPQVLTSCCATLFAAGAAGVGGQLAALPAGASRAIFLGLLALTLAAGWSFLRSQAPGAGGGRGPVPYALLAVVLGAVSAAAVVTWVAPAFYELPTHHCPFCLLSARAGYAGYLLYPALVAAVVAGAGSGLVHALRRLDPEGALRPGEERRLCKVSMVAFALFALISVWPLVAAGVRLEG